jgi:hypothetical protein
MERDYEKVVLPPVAGSVIHSLRSLGYSFESAVADLIDNSISAGASCIAVDIFLRNDEPVVTIVDDGCGMDESDLKKNLTIGSASPRDERSQGDLGRFGMGLKTASFAHALNLLCVSKTASSLSGIEWDLEHVAEEDEWEAWHLNSLAANAVLSDEGIDLGEHGTLVRWSECDRLLEGVPTSEQRAIELGAIRRSLSSHLSLIFHKFLSKPGGNLTLTLNGETIEAMDPFFKKASQEGATSYLLDQEPVKIGDIEIPFRAYLLPSPAKMTDRKKSLLTSIDEDFFSGQGFYIYREDRLIQYGSWMRIIKKNEAHKLGRCELNFSNSLDDIWGLDVMKSTVTLPHIVRTQLKKKIEKLAFKSQRTFNRTVTIKNPNRVSVWSRSVDGDTRSIRYKIDRSHPVVKSLSDALAGGEDDETLRTFVRLVEETMPVKMIANDIASDYELPSDRSAITDADRKFIDALLSRGLNESDIVALYQRDESLSARDFDEIQDYLAKKMEQ